MIKKLALTLMLATSCLIASAVSFKVAWCPNTETNVVAYKVYYTATNKIAGWTPIVYSNGTNCPVGTVISSGTNWLRNYSVSTNVGLTTTFTLSNAVVGKTYYMAVTAVDANGLESSFSNEAENTVTNFPPSAPQNLHIIDVK